MNRAALTVTAALLSMLVVMQLSDTCAAEPMRLQLLTNDTPETTGAVCLDGSSPGFYFRPASDPENAKRWLIYIKGGGWCYEPQDCLQRSGTILGSSDGWAPTNELGGMMSTDPLVSPSFYAYNHVSIEYCDGASFSGDVDSPVQVAAGTHGGANGTVYFRGHRILQRIFEVLMDDYGLDSATDVLLTGCSAGGLAVYLHCDEVAEMLHASERQLNYRCAPGSGFFLEHSNAAHQPVYPDQMQQVYQMQNLSALTVNRRCVQSFLTSHAHQPADAWKCVFAAHTYPFVSWPTFSINSAYDIWQQSCILTAVPVPEDSVSNGQCSALPNSCACLADPTQCSLNQTLAINGFADAFMTDFGKSLAVHPVGHGAFLYSCQTHCAFQSAFWNQFTVNGMTMQQAVTAWWTTPSTAPTAHHLHLPCHRPSPPTDCNPTCSSSPPPIGCPLTPSF
mmetsp:Transcript_8619/g.26759  ORF Transcript_8619/g.26759 Transcript_8619/m.26759 type:complete len:449 (-) Transcript_8619:23-1369(-)